MCPGCSGAEWPAGRRGSAAESCGGGHAVRGAGHGRGRPYAGRRACGAGARGDPGFALEGQRGGPGVGAQRRRGSTGRHVRGGGRVRRGGRDRRGRPGGAHGAGGGRGRSTSTGRSSSTSPTRWPSRTARLRLSPVESDSVGEQIQRAFPHARVVKTLNTVNCQVMVDPARVPGEHQIFVCGRTRGAKSRSGSARGVRLAGGPGARPGRHPGGAERGDAAAAVARPLAPFRSRRLQPGAAQGPLSRTGTGRSAGEGPRGLHPARGLPVGSNC